MKRDVLVFCALILIFMLNCGLVLQRQVEKFQENVANQDIPCNPDVLRVLETPEQTNENPVFVMRVLETPEQKNETPVYHTNDTYRLEMPEELKGTLNYDTPTPDTHTPITGFYHLAISGPWKEIFYDHASGTSVP